MKITISVENHYNRINAKLGLMPAGPVVLVWGGKACKDNQMGVKQAPSSSVTQARNPSDPPPAPEGLVESREGGSAIPLPRFLPENKKPP